MHSVNWNHRNQHPDVCYEPMRKWGGGCYSRKWLDQYYFSTPSVTNNHAILGSPQIWTKAQKVACDKIFVMFFLLFFLLSEFQKCLEIVLQVHNGRFASQALFFPGIKSIKTENKPAKFLLTHSTLTSQAFFLFIFFDLACFVWGPISFEPKRGKLNFQFRTEPENFTLCKTVGCVEWSGASLYRNSNLNSIWSRKFSRFSKQWNSCFLVVSHCITFTGW